MLTAVPRPGSSMAGRFAHLLDPADQGGPGRRLPHRPRRSHRTAQLRAAQAPQRERGPHPRLLDHVITVGEHTPAAAETIGLDDIAVTADARHFHLVLRSTGRRLDVRVLHALEAATQTPALARFLAEVAGARYAAYKPFDFGAAARLPYLPRVRYRRTVLAPSRWLLTAERTPPASGRPATPGTRRSSRGATDCTSRIPSA